MRPVPTPISMMLLQPSLEDADDFVHGRVFQRFPRLIVDF
jgi:hypothetical protein